MIFNEINEFPNNLEFSIQKYKRFHDFFILELLKPNAQRSGVVQDVTIGEVESARIFVTPEGLHRLLIANHKTGNYQSADLFLYPDVFDGLYLLVYKVLPEFPVYSTKNSSLNEESLVFNLGTVLLSPAR